MIAAITNASSLADYVGVFTATRRSFLPLVSIQKTERQIRKIEIEETKQRVSDAELRRKP